MRERFVNTFVSVLQIDVFANDRNLNPLLRADDSLDKFSPVHQVGLRSLKIQKMAHEFVQALAVQHQRIFVNTVFDIARFNDRFFRNTAKQRQLLSHIAVQLFFRPANQDLRLQTNLAQLCDALLGGFRF